MLLAGLMGFEPTAFCVTGRRSLQTDPQSQMSGFNPPDGGTSSPSRETYFADPVGLEPTLTRITAGRSAAELQANSSPGRD